MFKKIASLFLLLVMLICGISLSVTYSKYLLSKNVVGEVTVPEVDYCIRNGITSLSECMLVMENYSENVTIAQSYIASKGTPDFSNMAPLMSFVEKITTRESDIYLHQSTTNYILGKSYEFDETSGMFSITERVSDVLSDDYIRYYTCGNYSPCTKIYKILDTNTVEDSSAIYYRITKAEVHDYVIVDSFDSDVGLYVANDYDGGNTYYYRGNVTNNYVSYAGCIWKIVRRNSDGSVRIIYSGQTTGDKSANATIGSVKYNEKFTDAVNVGYMYSQNTRLVVSSTYMNGFDGAFSQTNKYVFSDSYTVDEENEKIYLSGNTFVGTWQDNYKEVSINYPYTCLKTNSSVACDYVLNLDESNVDRTSANLKTLSAKIISFSTDTSEALLENTKDSTIKKYVDSWYVTNILNKNDSDGKSYADYLSDAIFCNDRSYYSGPGYGVYPMTYFNGNKRVSNKSPSLTCVNVSDRFSVSTDIGNGKLTYPVALLTVDEALMAGVHHNKLNPNFYLDTNARIWLMTPSFTWPSLAAGRVYILGNSNNGTLYNGWVNASLYVKPVVNLKADIKIISGDGTAENPFVVDY